jgi:hypothetical protein
MKKLFKTSKLFMLTAVCGSALLLGCTDADYDLDKVDYTLGLGSGQLTLPSNNSVIVKLDDILNLGSTDLISIDANGDYRFEKDPEKVDPVTVKVDPINLSADNYQDYAFIFNLPNEVMDLPITTIDCSTLPQELQNMLTISKDVRKMDYVFTVPNEVKSLSYVAVGGENGVSLKLNLTMPSLITKSEITLDLPDVLDIPQGVESGNIVRLTNPSGANTIELIIKGIRIKQPTSADDTDYAYIDNGEFKMKGNINLTLKINELNKPSTPTVDLNATVSVGAITITSATGVFKPTINVQQVGSTTITSLPDFLSDARVVADIDNPQIWLDITSNMPLGGIVEARLGSTSLNGFVTLTKAQGNALPIVANGQSRLVICRKDPEGLSGYTPIIASNLSDIVHRLNEGMKITIDITSFEATQTENVTILLGEPGYTLTPAYRFTAPLALGDEAVIIYNDNEGDWNKDIDKIQLSDGSKATLTANVKNGVPADIEINITPLDKNGQVLTALTITPIKNKVLAGVVDGEIQYEIADTNGNGLKQLDGINYHLSVTAPSDATLKGKTLNKNQQIILNNIKLQLNGKVVVDAN